jgi:hypothetical protein
MDLKYLRTFIKEQIELYPDLKSQMVGLYELCIQEIEDGDSVSHQVDLCIFDIKELIEEYLEENKK